MEFCPPPSASEQAPPPVHVPSPEESPRSRSGQGSGSPEEAERSAHEAARRARGKVRRYCAANRLNRLGTLTYRGAGCHDPLVAREHIGEFFRGLRRSIGGKALPYLWTDEWHPGGHGLHLHFSVAQYVRRSALESNWGHGFLHIKLIGDLPVGSGSLEEARRAARYLAKYVGKDSDRPRAGLHRYEVAQGFQPREIWMTGRSADEVIALAADRIGAAPDRIWRSSDEEQWDGPPAVWMSWNR